MLNKALRLVLSVAAATLAASAVVLGSSAAATDQQPLPHDAESTAGAEDFYKSLVENFVGDELVVSLERAGDHVIPVVHHNQTNGTGRRVTSAESFQFLRRYSGMKLAKIFSDFTARSLTGGHYLNKIADASIEKFCATDQADQEIENIHLKRPMDGKPGKVSYDVDVLSVVDYELFKKMGTVPNLINYLRIYWYMVDKRFRTLQNVQIKIKLKAIMYSSSRIVDMALMDTRDSLEARVDTSKEKFSKAIAGFRGIFDVAHLMTSRRLYTEKDRIKRYGAFGAAHSISSACNVTSSIAYNSGIAEDDGIFGGVLPSAHVIAHNLGAHHDGTKHAESCFGGYLMSPKQLLNSSDNLLFSSCSASAMSNAYFKKGAECLQVSSQNHFKYSEFPAGAGMSLDTQCTLKMGVPYSVYHKAVNSSESCFNLSCKFRAFGAAFSAHANTPALEGTQCNVNLYCQNGRCLPRIEGQ